MMSLEDKIVKDIIGKFKISGDKCYVKRQRRIVIEAGKDIFYDIIKYIANELSFTQLCTITGLDLADRFQLIYHLANDDGVLINLKLDVDRKKPTVETVTEFYRGATLYERELLDMFGIKVKGLPEGYRYPLPDSWPKDQHPLRKNWQPSEHKKDRKES